jgi:hypothetical protein
LTCGTEWGVDASCVRWFLVLVRVRAARGGGGLVSGTGVRESVTILALPEQVRVARAFVAGGCSAHRTGTLTWRCCWPVSW